MVPRLAERFTAAPAAAVWGLADPAWCLQLRWIKGGKFACSWALALLMRVFALETFRLILPSRLGSDAALPKLGIAKKACDCQNCSAFAAAVAVSGALVFSTPGPLDL